MAKQKLKQKVVKMTKEERLRLKQQLCEMSKITPEELLMEMKKDARGIMSVGVTLDFCWERYKEVAGMKMPERAEGVSDEEYAAQQQTYEAFVSKIRKIARYWYLAGMNHEDNFKQTMEIIEAQE